MRWNKVTVWKYSTIVWRNACFTGYLGRIIQCLHSFSHLITFRSILGLKGQILKLKVLFQNKKYLVQFCLSIQKKIDARQLKTPKIASKKVKPSLLPGFPAIAQTTMACNFVHLLSVHGSTAYVAFFNIFEKFYFISIYFLKIGFFNIGGQKPKFEIAIL